MGNIVIEVVMWKQSLRYREIVPQVSVRSRQRLQRLGSTASPLKFVLVLLILVWLRLLNLVISAGKSFEKVTVVD